MRKLNHFCILFLLITTTLIFGNKNLKFITEPFTFTFEGKKYNGLIDLPSDRKPSSIIVLIHGHGKTDVVNKNWYYKSRSGFIKLGMGCCIWDKAGCGKSEGTYNHHQPVDHSAREALAAIKELKKKYSDKVPVGLWGISRAGWICPIIIANDSSIAFWISVSGTDQFDNSRYLVKTNMRISGRSQKDVEMLIKEWDHTLKVLRCGGQKFPAFKKATANLFADTFYKKFAGGLSEEDFHRVQKYYQKPSLKYDKETGLMILVENFPAILQKVKCPVLAIFGEKDSQVDWRASKALYEKTIKKSNSDLTIKVLTDCNHNMQICDTGGLYEDLKKYKWKLSQSYYDSMHKWLQLKGFTGN